MQALIVVGINLLLSAALWGIGMLLRRPKHTKGPQVDNRETQISSYGIPKPILYGRCKTAMELIWATKLKEHAITHEVGKGGGDTYTEYQYTVSWAGLFGIAPDPAVFGTMQLLKLYCDDKLVFNAATDSESGVVQKPWVSKRFKFYSGSATQLPDPTMEAVLGNNEVPGYRHKCYGVVNEKNVTENGNRVPTIRAVVMPGTAAAYGFYPVTGASDVAHSDDCEDVWCQTVLSQDEMWLYHAKLYYDTVEIKDTVIWRKISTYSRTVITERIYYEDDAIFSGKGDYLWNVDGTQRDWDVDELNRIYAGRPNYFTRLDGDTFTVEAWSPEAIPVYQYQNMQVRVSRNPIYPYLWSWDIGGNDTVYLSHRETLANPFDAASNVFRFNPPDGSHGYIAAGDINHQNGSVWIFWQHSGSATMHLSKLYFDGRREDIDVTSALSGLNSYTCTRLVCYDKDNDQLIIGGYKAATDFRLYFLNCSTYALEGYLSLDYDWCWVAMSGFKRGMRGNYLYFLSTAGKILKIDATARTATEMADISGEIPGGNSLMSGVYVSYKESMFVGLIKSSINLHETTLGRITAGSVYLDDMVSDICLRSGLSAADINVAQLSSDVVKGYLVSQDQSAREAIEPLMEAFIFDGMEIDGILTFVKRGGASVATIPEADLAAHRFGEERPEPLEIEFQDETELPRRVEVHYPDVSRKHEAGVQHYGRQVTDSKLIKKIQTPILMDKDDAKQLAHIAMKYDWKGKPCTLSLGPKYARLMPTDVATIQKSEGDYRVLLLEAQREGLLTNWKGLIEEIDYTSTVEGTPGPPVDDEVEMAGPSIYYLLDLPPLLDSHNQAGVYAASGALFEDWTGCTLWHSKDSGDTWTHFVSCPARAMTGVVTVAPEDHEFVARDRHSAMTIRWDFADDALATVTESQLLQGQGHYLAIMKSNGDIEIVCARDVVTEADDSQTFSNLIRGCKGTEHVRTGHVVGEKVVRLNMTSIFLKTLDATYLNQSYLYNGVSHGEEWEDGQRKIFETELRTLKPWAGVEPGGARDGSNNLTITWNRRNRLYGLNELLTGNEIPMSETTEAYEIDIYDGATVVRTITGLTDETASYTAAQQTADGLTPGDPVDCKIYQLSSVVSRGWPLEAII